MQQEDIDKAHRYFAIECFNQCWDFLYLEERNAEQLSEMIRLSETSFWHWNRVSSKTEKNISIGLWQLSRVYSVAGQQNTALEYGFRCLEVSDSAELDPFFVAYAYEAIARAQKETGGDYSGSFSKACQLAETVEDKESREMLLKDLAQVDDFQRCRMEL